MPLECPVCLEAYNLSEKKPKSLQCNHTVCDRCATKLIRGDSVECPTCRCVSNKEVMDINYSLVEVIAERCEVCLKQTRFKRCRHCDKELCEDCLGQHANTYYMTVKQEMEALRSEVQRAVRAYIDYSHIEKELTQESEMVQQIKQVNQNRKDELDESERELTSEVKSICDANVSKRKEWLRTRDLNLERYRSFVSNSIDRLGIKYTKECTTDYLADVHAEIEDLSDNMRQLQAHVPATTEYTLAAYDMPSLKLGKVLCHPRRLAKYEDAACRSVAGREGTEPDQFTYRARITCVEDTVLVVDADSHGVKVYSEHLEFQFMFGKNGDGRHEFSTPNGVCSFGNEFFVSDEVNNRIKIFSKTYQLLRIFGSKGSGRNNFDCPLGLAAGPNGELHICDASNYRVKVIRPDGTYLRRIGVRGTRPGEFNERPERVAVSLDGRVLVIVRDYLNVHIFNKTGDFMGLLVSAVPNTEHPLALRSIALSKSNTVVLTDYKNDRLIVMNVDGEFVCTIGTSGSNLGQLKGPWDVTFNKYGNIVVYEEGNHRLQIFDVQQSCVSDE